MSKQANQADLQGRDPALLSTDKAAVEAIVQAAVNVELFTIPLYMATMYSIQGVHQITGSNNLYEGRLWPGLSPTYKPGARPSKNIPENEKAFNTIFSVFVEEMLHLQLASNIATILGITPEFTQLSPEYDNYAWSCYGKDLTVIPNIVDFKDCKDEWKGVHYNNIRVKLGELDLIQNDLFLAIEAPEQEAKDRLKDEVIKSNKYFPTAPFKNWEPGDALPMFGSIGQMYQCLWDYLQITYSEGPSLFESMYAPGALQRDLFNTSGSGHPYREYQGIETTVEGWLPESAKKVIFKLICAITDQGEGNDIKEELEKQHPELKPMVEHGLLKDVKPVNQASDVALQADYPSYNDKGDPLPPKESSHAYARTEDGWKDHYQRFEEIRDDLNSGKIVTWPTWHKAGNKWKAEDLVTADFKKDNYNIPSAADVAGALNRLNSPDGATPEESAAKRDANYQQFCQIATGAIAGITSVLNDYWRNPNTGFPFPSMGGSGDRVMMCWAVFGQFPDLSVGVAPKARGILYHACQGMDLSKTPSADNNCASKEIYHNCRGSNTCKGEGGCGFVQEVGKSQTCSHSVMMLRVADPLCGQPKTLYSAPSDNLCKSFGGCAVPISASQVFPKLSTNSAAGVMALYDFVDPNYKPEKLSGTINFKLGDLVYDKAWEAYTQVLASRGTPAPDKPKPSDIRIAFPPST